MSVKLNDLVSQLVMTASPGELQEVKENLNSIVPGQSTSIINKSIEEFIQENGMAFSGQYIASKYTKDEGSSKFVDFVGKQKFNFDLKAGRVTDLEHFSPTIDYPQYFDQLVSALQRYGEDHYPSEYAFTVIPTSSGVEVIIIGQKINEDNFYSGRWKSFYSIDAAGSISGVVNLDIHYYEDGNVRLSFEEPVGDASLQEVSGSSIVNYINNSENKLTMKIIEDFNLLNQKYFKNLRRLLPVTKSKINWGKAIGTYRLGSDVVNK